MVDVACRMGASGVAVGRAVWQEASHMQGQERQAFLREVARPRMRRLTELCSALRHPWTDFYTPLQPGSDWYQKY